MQLLTFLYKALIHTFLLHGTKRYTFESIILDENHNYLTDYREKLLVNNIPYKGTMVNLLKQ